MEAKSIGESAHKAKTDEGKKDGATRGRQDLKQMGRTEEENRGERRVNSARGRSTERILAAENRRIGKDEGNLGHNNQGGNMEADVSTQNKDFNMEEFMDQVRKVGKGGEVKVPTNISLPTSSGKSVLPITNNSGANVDEVKIPLIISEPKAIFSELPITSDRVLPTTGTPNTIFSKLPPTNNKTGENIDEEEDVQIKQLTSH